MATRKNKPVPDDLPRCEHCNAGIFEPGDPTGECHLLPMKWYVVNGDLIAAWDPAKREGWCRHFDRRCHA